MKKLMVGFVLAWSVLCAGTLSVSAAVTYSVDDGVSENAIGLTLGGNVWWANAFTVLAGGESINSVQVAFSPGTVTAGLPFQVMVYEDPDDDGDPSTGPLQLMALSNATIADATGGTFQDIPVGPATVSGGFFIAALISHPAGEYPAALDQTASQGVSWIAGNSATPIDPASPLVPVPDTGVLQIDSIGFPGNWLLRAVGGTAAPAIPVPLAVTRPATDIDLVSATLNGLVGANGYDATVTFEYGTDTGYGNTVAADQSPVTGLAETPVSAAISGLTPGVVYHFRVVAKNLLGTSYGRDLTFTATPTTALLYFPRTDTAGGWQTEIALVNTSIHQYLTGYLEKFSRAGRSAGTTSFVLYPHGRMTMAVTGEDVSHISAGFNADPGIIQGYARLYRNGVCRAAVPAVTRVNTGELLIPHIASNDRWWTGISLMNTGPDPTDITLTFNDGRSIVRSIAGDGQTAFTIAQLFDGQSQPGIKSGTISNDGGIVGLVLFGTHNGSQLEGVRLSDETFSTLYFPHVADNATWWTGVAVYNPADSECGITISAYSQAGDLLSVSSDVIPGRENLVRTTSALGLPASAAWFKIEAATPITGFALYGTRDGNQLAAYGVNGQDGTNRGVFAGIERDGWTGIVLVNTETEAADITLTAYLDNGMPMAIEKIHLGAYARVMGLAESIFAEDISDASYIAFVSTGNLVGLQLNGTADGVMLDGLPVLFGNE